MGKEKELLTTMKYRKLEYMGHLRSNQQYNVLRLYYKKKEMWEEDKYLFPD